MMLTSVSAGLSDLGSAAEFAKHPSEHRPRRCAGSQGAGKPESGRRSHRPLPFSRASSTAPHPHRIPNARRPAGLGRGAGRVPCSRQTGEVTCGEGPREVTCGLGTQRSSSARSALSPCPLPLPPLLARGCGSRSRRPCTAHQMASLSARPPDVSREPEPKRSHPTPAQPGLPGSRPRPPHARPLPRAATPLPARVRGPTPVRASPRPPRDYAQPPHSPRPLHPASRALLAWGRRTDPRVRGGSHTRHVPQRVSGLQGREQLRASNTRAAGGRGEPGEASQRTAHPGIAERRSAAGGAEEGAGGRRAGERPALHCTLTVTREPAGPRAAGGTAPPFWPFH